MPVPTVNRPATQARPLAAATIAPTRAARSLLVGQGGGGSPLPVTLGQASGYPAIATGETGNDNALLASRWVLESRYGDVKVNALQAYFQNQAGSVRLGLYTDSSNLPGSLVVAAPEVAVVNGRTRSAIASPPTISPGAYWLVAALSSSTVGIGSRSGFQGQLSRYLTRTYQALPASWPGGGSSQDLHRCIFAECEATTLTKPSDPAAPSAPSPIAGQGYSLVFRDEFEWLDRDKWTNMVWYDQPGRPDCQYVDSSVLHIVAKQADGWPNHTMDTLGFRNFNTGYFECRMRDTGSRASFPAFWLFSDDWAMTSNCGAGDRAAELDVVELWGSQFPNVLSNTAHSDSANVCTANNQGPLDSFNDVGIPTVATWRTYGMKWTPTALTWYLDNVETNSLPIGAGTDWTTYDRPMHVILYTWPDRGFTIDGQQWPMPTPGVDPAEIHAEFDWVRVWQQ